MSDLRVPASGLRPGPLTLSREAGRYVTQVRRLGIGARFVLFDPEARLEADAVLERAGAEVVVELGEPRAARLVPLRAATVIQCVGKADKLDQVVRDATELGATAILPAISERSVAKRTTESALHRLRRIAVEAARQCGRGDVPHIAAPRPLTEVLSEAAPGVRVALDPLATTPLAQALSRPNVSTFTFVVGPEGGLTATELAESVERGFERVRFGRFVLRTETVAAAVLGALTAIAEQVP